MYTPTQLVGKAIADMTALKDAIPFDSIRKETLTKLNEFLAILNDDDLAVGEPGQPSRDLTIKAIALIQEVDLYRVAQ